MFNLRSLLRLSVVLALSLTQQPNACGQSTPDAPVGEKWALVIGVSKFKSPGINLQYAAKDARDFSDFLVQKAGFPADHVKVLIDEEATEKAILSNLGGKWLPNLAGPDDLVVVFVSSHGSSSEMDSANVNYILAHDSEVEDLFATALEMQDITGMISKRIKSKRIVLIIDACHSGAVLVGDAQAGSKGLTRKNVNLDAVGLGSGKFVLLSSQPNEVSWELKQSQNSIFTRCLIEALSKASEDTSLLEVYKSLRTNVLQTALKERGVPQTPVMKSTWMGGAPILSAGRINSKVGEVAQVPVTIASNPPAAATVTKHPPSPVQVPAQSEPLDSIAVIPFIGPQVVHIMPSKNVLWGKVTNESELANLGPKLSAKLFTELRDKYNDRILGPRMVSIALTDNPNVTPADKVNTTAWTQSDWQKLGKSTQAKYLITGSVDEADWATSMMSNKYDVKVSAKLVSGETGQVLAVVNGLKVHKAPFKGDLSGGPKYFANEVMEDVSEELVKSFKPYLATKKK